MGLIPRVNLIIYSEHIEHEGQIRKHGHIIYTNRSRKYIIVYASEYEVDGILQKLMKLKYVLHIGGSPCKNLKKTYDKEKHETL